MLRQYRHGVKSERFKSFPDKEKSMNARAFVQKLALSEVHLLPGGPDMLRVGVRVDNTFGGVGREFTLGPEDGNELSYSFRHDPLAAVTCKSFVVSPGGYALIGLVEGNAETYALRIFARKVDLPQDRPYEEVPFAFYRDAVKQFDRRQG